MPLAPFEELALLPIEAHGREPLGHWASARLSEARGVFGSAARLVMHPSAERVAHRGRGWFDSSWELHSGCEVREGWPADATLREWLEAWVYPAAGASLSAR